MAKHRFKLFQLLRLQLLQRPPLRLLELKLQRQRLRSTIIGNGGPRDTGHCRTYQIGHRINTLYMGYFSLAPARSSALGLRCHHLLSHNTMNPYDEPLEISAPIAWDLAARYCRHDPATGVTCAWNHGLWQLLRLMGIAGTAARRSEFYRREIRKAVAGKNRPAILISGASDYAMLAQIALEFAELNTTPAVTVLDICETPLQLNQWFADRAGFSIQTVRSDFLEYASPEQFDVVCADSFIGRFPYAQWPKVAERFFTLLKQGGTLLTASRLRTNDPSTRITFPADHVTAFRDTVRANLLKADAPAGFDLELATTAAEQYARLQVNYPLHTMHELRAPLELAGLVIQSLDHHQHGAGQIENIRAPSVAAASTFLLAVATRP